MRQLSLKTVGRLACGLASALVIPTGSMTAHAAEKFLGDVFIVAAPYCPRGSLPTNGQIVERSNYEALYMLIGSKFGGNGVSNFALPDLRGRAPVGAGQGPGLSAIAEGQSGGRETVTLTTAQLPPHVHAPDPRVHNDHHHTLQGHSHGGKTVGTTAAPSVSSPAGGMIGTFPPGANFYTTVTPTGGEMASDSITMPEHLADTTLGTVAVGSTGVAGQSEPLNSRSPYTALQFCIVTQGLFPSRS